MRIDRSMRVCDNRARLPMVTLPFTVYTVFLPLLGWDEVGQTGIRWDMEPLETVINRTVWEITGQAVKRRPYRSRTWC